MAIITFDNWPNYVFYCNITSFLNLPKSLPFFKKFPGSFLSGSNQLFLSAIHGNLTGYCMLSNHITITQIVLQSSQKLSQHQISLGTLNNYLISNYILPCQQRVDP